MNTFEVELGGVVYDVEAETEEEAVSAAKQYHMTEGALDRSIDRMDGPVAPGMGKRIDNTGRAIARGVPVAGAFADELAAFGDAAISYPFELINENITGFEPRDEDWREAMKGDMPFRDRVAMALRKERGRDKEFDEEHPVVSTAGKIGGAAMGGGALFRMAPYLFGSEKLLPSMLTSGATGSVLAGGHALGEGEGDIASRAEKVPQAMLTGGLIGAAMPALTRGAEWLYQKGANKLGEMTGMFGAPTKVEREMGNMFSADDVTPEMLREMNRPGIVAMNASPTAEELGQQIARAPGPAGKKMVEAAEVQKNVLGNVVANGDKAVDQAAQRAADNADRIIGAGRDASRRVAIDTAQRLGAPRPAGSQDILGITESVANLVGVPVMGRGGIGSSLKDIGRAIGNRLRAGQMDQNFMEAARILMSSGPEVADMLTQIATSMAATREQAAVIGQVLRSLTPAAATAPETYKTGGSF